MIDFEQNDILSLWVGTSKSPVENDDFDALKEWAGVTYYDEDLQEYYYESDLKLLSIKKLLKELSYSECFLDEAVKIAEKLKLKKARWALLQIDFKYDPNSIVKTLPDDFIFIGSFPYED